MAYGLTASLTSGSVANGPRSRLRGQPTILFYILAAALRPGGKRVMLYSVQTLKRFRPQWFRDDLLALFDLRLQRKIEPQIAAEFPLTATAQAHELLAAGSVVGKIVLRCH